MFSRLNLRVKLILFFSLTFALVALFNFTYYPSVYKRQSMENLRHYTQNTAEMLALTCGISFELMDFESIRITIEWAKKDSRLAYLGISDKDGKEIAVFNPKKLNLDLKDFGQTKEVREFGDRIFVAIPIIYNQHNHGTLLMGLSLEELYATIAANRLTTLYISVGIFALGLFLAFVFSKSAMGREYTLMNAIATSSQVLSRLTKEIGAAVGNQVTVASQQSAMVTEITATMGELSTSSSMIADNCKTVADTASKGLTQAESGTDAIRVLKEKMDEITESNNNNSKEMIRLGEKSNEIGKIMQIINNIADQTKLIAFNAAIEAAGAGEAGNRFGIVATEIRRLADNIMDSTEEIERKIEEIQQVTRRLIIASEAESKHIKEGASLTGHTSSELKELVGGAQSTSSIASQMSVATQEQKLATNQVAVGLREIDLGIRQSFDSTKHVSTAIAELTSLAGTLSRLVNDLLAGQKNGGDGKNSEPREELTLANFSLGGSAKPASGAQEMAVYPSPGGEKHLHAEANTNTAHPS